MQVKFARSIVAGAALAFGLAFATPASAQVGFVVQGNYGDDVDFGVGGGVNFGLGSLTTQHGIRAEATFDYYFPGDGVDFDGFDADFTYWELNANAMKDIPSVPGLYVGAGVNYATFSYDYDCDGNPVCEAFDFDSNDIGLNLLGGWNFSGSKGPFVQAKFELGGGEQLVISGGIRF